MKGQLLSLRGAVAIDIMKAVTVESLQLNSTIRAWRNRMFSSGAEEDVGDPKARTGHSPAEIATALSHFAVWDAARKAAGPTLVLEDDLDVQPHILELLNKMRVRTDFDVLAVADFLKYAEDAIIPTAYRVWTVSFISLAGYVVSPQGAASLYERAWNKGMNGAWDWFVLRGVKDLRLVLLRSDPALVVHRCKFASSINEQQTSYDDICEAQRKRDLQAAHLRAAFH
jgi:GR25 family glycosyltransferase involved in LPS biosynthesis